jgi:IPT/TIG domain-containing protein
MSITMGGRAALAVFLAVVVITGSLTSCSTPDSGVGQASGDVQSRGTPQMQQSKQAASPGQPGAQLPTFPQKFSVQGPETQVFGFAVTQPGPISIDVQGQGAPVVVTLQSPGGQPITQQATGNLHMSHNVAQQDVQSSLFWTVQVRLAQPMPPQAGGRASGAITVQYPPVNQAAVQQAVQAVAAQQRQPTDQEKAQAAAQAKAFMDGVFNDHKARFEQQDQQRRAAMLAERQPFLAQMQAKGAVRPRGVEEAPVSETPSATGEDVTGRGMARSRGVEEAPAGEVPSAPGDDVTSRGGFASGSLILSPAMILPNPSITSLSRTQGQSGTSVLITGTGFGTNAGEVHFVIAPGNDKIAPATSLIWQDTGIFAIVPDASGVATFDGTIYIKRATDKVNSNLMPFRFIPLTELRQIRCPNDDFILEKLVYTSLYSCTVWRVNQNWFWTPQGNDQFFVNTRLQNGWMVVQPPIVYLPNPQYSAGGAYLADSRVGSDSPYVNVRYWVNAGFSNNLGYATSVLIQGPKGVPDGVVCTQIPC